MFEIKKMLNEHPLKNLPFYTCHQLKIYAISKHVLIMWQERIPGAMHKLKFRDSYIQGRQDKRMF